MKASNIVRLGYGALLLTAPNRAVSLASANPGHTADSVARVLGARHIAQALVLSRWSGSAARRLGAVIDLLHACTAAVLAVVDDRYRRAALIDTAVAATFAVTEVAGDGRR